MVILKVATKKKFKLKKKFKKRLKLLTLFLVIVLICSFGGTRIYETLEYHKTIEYKFLQKGYELETYKLIEEKCSEKNRDYLLNEEKIDYIKFIVGDKYYIDKNFYEYLEYYNENSKKDFTDIVAIVNVHATKPWYEESIMADISHGYEILVNKSHILPETFDAGTIKTFSSTYAYGTVTAEETCYNAFIRMANAAKQDGITLILTSGYRTREKQTSIYDEMKNSKGETYADEYAARPGSSEHETGLALDILTYNAYTETFKTTEAYTWLHAHAHEYGFIERYPENKEHLTGYKAESWHYRYLGEDLAKKVKDEGITYDEYYAFYVDK